MSDKGKYFLRKGITNLIILIIGILIMVSFLSVVQHQTSKLKQKQQSEALLDQIEITMKNNEEDAKKLEELYHACNVSTLNDMKSLLTSGLFDDLTNASEKERTQIFNNLIEKAQIGYLFIMDDSGRIVLCPDDDFFLKNMVDVGMLTEDNFKTLLDTASNDPVIEDNSYGKYYFYSTKIEKYYLVLGANYDVLNLQLSSLNGVEKVLKNVAVGNGGFVFAVNPASQTFAYFEDNDKVYTGLSILDSGLSERAVSILSNQDSSQLAATENIFGTKYYCVSRNCGDITFTVAAISQDNIYNATSQVLLYSVGGFVITTILVLLYAVFVRDDLAGSEVEIEKYYFRSSKLDGFFYNKTVGKKLFPLAILGIMVIFGISFYSQTLLALSDAIVYSKNQIVDIENEINEADLNRGIIENYYENQFLSKAQLLAFLLEEDPAVLNVNRDNVYYQYHSDGSRSPVKDEEGNLLKSISFSSGLKQFCDENSINSVFIYDDQGRTIATTRKEWFFELSQNAEEQSYPFRNVLEGKEKYFIQDAIQDEMGSLSQYIGVRFNYYTTTKNNETYYVSKYDYEKQKDGLWQGAPITKHSSLLQIELNNELMNRMLESTDYEYLMASHNNASGSFLVLFDATEDHRVIYSPKESSIGKKASEIGVSDKAFLGNYTGFERVNGNRYFQDYTFYKGYYIATATPLSLIYNARFPLACIAAFVGAVFILVMSGMVTLSTDKEEAIYRDSFKFKLSETQGDIMFNILMPHGHESVTEKAEARWDNRNIPWIEKTPEQKLLTIASYVLGFVIISILITLTLKSELISEDSIIRYIISGGWDQGLNIFAFTACALVFITTIVGVNLLSIPVRLFTSVLGAKSETIGHLTISVIKYGASVCSLFYCLYLVGFDSKSLITSAGILSLIVGLGSQSLIKDVVAGIFIIFEGEFRVGDIVEIAGYRGQVLDIGLRTTKIMNDSQNIKIIKNDSISGVVNMTRVTSMFILATEIAFAHPIDEIEAILEEELPLVQEKIPSIVRGPIYKGITGFNQKSYTISIEASCKEKDMIETKAALNKEIISILHRHHINAN